MWRLGSGLALPKASQVKVSPTHASKSQGRGLQTYWGTSEGSLYM